jgi:glycosyltransferase involved in cell wall biosynthesis
MRMAAPSGPLVSVIVPVRHDVEGVRDLVDRLAEQTLPRERFEIVIGDDGSPRGSLAGLSRTDGWVRITRGPRETSYAARNRAAALARGSVLAFCDSDCLPDPDWLVEGVAALDDAEVVAGQVTFAAPPSPTAWALLTVDMYLDQERNVLRSRGVTANLFVKRHVFRRLGGFDESLPSGGDYDFVQRSVRWGARLAYGPAAVVRHPTIDHALPFLRKVWITNRWSSARRVRAQQPPAHGASWTVVPFIGVMRARRDALRPALRLHRQRLAESGLSPSALAELGAMARLYLVIAYVAKLARARGWIDGRRFLRRGDRPRLADFSAGEAGHPVHAADDAGVPAPHPAHEATA